MRFTRAGATLLLALAFSLATSIGVAAAAPDPPRSLTATPGDSQVTLSWQPPANTGGSPIAFYSVSAAPGGFQSNTADGTTTTMVVTGLTNGTSYGFSVKASNADGLGPAATISATPQVPVPKNAYISLDVTAGGTNTTITVSGGMFLPNEAMSIYWDSPNKVLQSTKANGQGNFSGVKVKPFAGEPPGVHHICASVQPNPCAQFALQGNPTPTPSPKPTPSESPSSSPSASPTPSESPTPIIVPAGSNTNGLDVLIRPPFIFLPFLAALALIGAIAYWALGAARNRQPSIPSASIVHRSVRPGLGMDVDMRTPPVGPTPDAAPYTPDEPPVPPTDGGDEAPPITES